MFGSRKPRPAPASGVVELNRPDGGFELCMSDSTAGISALRSHVHFVRGSPVQFAAILPGDGVAEAIVTPLATVVDPYLNLFRGIIPPLGGIDFSPILAFVVLDLFTNSAAALPAEMDEQGRLKEQPRARLNLKQAWQRRMEATAARRAAQQQQQQ
ncbi:hypothetical protein COHA_003975 [Chlorella ohadii]|uniref:Uncharacterized protein n=1 Tax=Chlorella ohadii TaxID=2649997 RepID=A0AAD5DQY1_9CHLO|nr:hypothetical protein COHA_003975 [Chlorella ohadii]